MQLLVHPIFTHLLCIVVFPEAFSEGRLTLRLGGAAERGAGEAMMLVDFEPNALCMSTKSIQTYIVWLVVSNIFLFSISYMGCHPSHWRTPSFFKMVMSPPTSCIYIYIYYCMTWGENPWFSRKSSGFSIIHVKIFSSNVARHWGHGFSQ